MDQFHDRQHVWLRSRVRGTYLHADHDGVRVSLSGRRASMKAAWTVHLYRDEDDVQYVLLYSAAYGRYLAATDDPVPLGLCGFHVEQRNYGPPEVAGIRWQAGPILWDLASGDIQLRHVGRYGNRFLRANGKYLRWINRVTVDDAKNITDMMRWVVEPIPARLGRPDLPRPTRDRLPGDLSVVMLGRKAATWQMIPFVRAADDGSYPEDSEEGWADTLRFRGRSVHRLREELAKCLGLQRRVLDLIVCIRAGRGGRLTPLVVNLPRNGTIEIIAIMDGTPGSAALRHPDVNAS